MSNQSPLYSLAQQALHTTTPAKPAAWRLKDLEHFIGQHQLQAIAQGLYGEDAPYFRDRLADLIQRIRTMPRIRESDPERPIAQLHYFHGNADWYVIERDNSDAQLQAFGHADLFGDGGELGYLHLPSLFEAGVELDLHFQPQPIHDILQARKRD